MTCTGMSCPQLAHDAFGVLPTVASAALLAGLASCVAPSVRDASLRAPARLGAPASLRQSVQQVPLGGTGWFALCDLDCQPPTPKTVGGPMPVVAVTLAVDRLQDRSADGSPTLPPPRVEHLSLGFALGSAMLPADQRQRLRDLALQIGSAAVIRIEGRTDSIGSQAANDQLAAARAQAVLVLIRDELLVGPAAHAGLPPELRVSSQGRCCYLQDNKTEAGRTANRRVDVTVEPEGPQQTAKVTTPTVRGTP